MRPVSGVAGVVALGLWVGLAAARPLDEQVSYPEGAAYIGGKLYYVGYGDNTVYVWDGKKRRVFRQLVSWWSLDKKCGPTAVVAVGKDELLIACYDNNTLVRLNNKGETIGAPVKVDVGPNDFVRDSRGGIYFSTSGGDFTEAEARNKTVARGKIYYRDPEGRIRRVAHCIRYANGLALVNGGKQLLVAETFERRILKFQVNQEDGGLSKRDVWRDLCEIKANPRDMKWYIGPDGLKVDSKGNLYICQFGAGRVLVTDKDGKWLRTLSVPYQYVTNVALDPGNEKVYITAAKDGLSEKDPGGAVYEVLNR